MTILESRSIAEGMGQGIGGTSNDSFADILNQQKNAIGYVVVYRGEDLTSGRVASHWAGKTRVPQNAQG